jgi:hypothetical protein
VERPLTILLWHVHGSWTTSFVHGPHRYLVACLPDRGPDGRGRAATYAWPDEVEEIDPVRAASEPVDVVLLQRSLDVDLAPTWLGGRRPGRDIPAVYVEHNAPQGRIADMRHPLAERDDITVVHVSHFNALFWDTGRARTRVIEHGVVDPGHRARAELPRGVVAINEAHRRGRVTGTDLIGALSAGAPLDLFGIDAERLGGRDVTQAELHDEMARRRVYVHPFRWTSLGLTLIEAMLIGLPVVALDTTAIGEAVPPDAGVVSNRVEVLAAAVAAFAHDPDLACEVGGRARRAALERYSLDRFLRDWNELLLAVTGAG